MAAGDFFAKTKSVSPGSVLIVDGTTSSTGAVEIHTVASTGAITAQTQVDSNGNGTFDITLTVDETASAVHSQKNKIEVSKLDNIRLRIINEDSATNSIHATGVEISS